MHLLLLQINASQHAASTSKKFLPTIPVILPPDPDKYKLPNIAERSTANNDPAYLRAANYCRENRIDIAVLACDKSETDAAAICLADADIKGIWNFSGKEIETSKKNICITDMNMPDILLGLCCEITNKNIPGTAK